MRVYFLILPLILCGCSAGSQAPVHESPSLPINYSEMTGAIPQSAGARWWSAFRDPGLDGIIQAGLANNLDIKTALLRIDAAQDNITVAGAGGLPSINLDASHVRNKQTGAMKDVDGVVDTSTWGASATWLIDVFGEVRSQILSAKASRNAAIEAVSVARLVLLSDIATAYVDAKYYQELGTIGARAVQSRQHVVSLTRKLASQGIASDVDIGRAQQAAEAIIAELPGYDASFRKASNRLSTLMGAPAGMVIPALHNKGGQPLPAFDPDSGIPADLVRNRPDIRKAEEELAGAVADIGYARAQLFPTITLSGSITSSYISTDAKSGDLNKWSFGPSLRLPIFEGGKLRANVRIAATTAQQKEIAWRAAVLKAVEEVENALVAYNRSQVAVRSQMARVAAIQKTVRLSKAAYDAGLNSRLDILDAETDLFDAQSDLAFERRNVAQNFIALNIAVGRGLPGPGGVDITGSVACHGPACGKDESKGNGKGATSKN
jgi:outer membrane protein, multidrug efflux system